MIYLDNATTSRPCPQVIDAMLPFFREQWGTPGAPHPHGQRLQPAIEKATRQLYALVEATEDDLFEVAGSGAEAVNHVIFGTYTDVTRKTGKNHFVTSRQGEAAHILAMTHLQKLGCVMEMAPVDAHGQVSASALAETLTPRTALVSLSYANGLTGVIQPLEEIAALCQERGVLLHVDMTHAVGKGDFPWQYGDFLTFGSEQMQGPPGCGALFMRSHVSLSPLIFGAAPNVPLLVGMGAAADIARAHADFYSTEVVRLRTLFEKEAMRAIPGACIAFEKERRLPHMTAINFPRIASEALLYLLSRKGLYASMGGGAMQQISYILGGHCGLSFALSYETTEEELQQAVVLLAEMAAHLQRCAL